MDNFNLTEQINIIVACKTRDGRKYLSRKKERNILELWTSGDDVNSESWFIINSGYFNALKDLMNKMLSDKSFDKEGNEELEFLKTLHRTV